MTSRRGFLTSLAGAALAGAAGPHPAHPAPQRPRPAPSQLLWQRDELALFVHFGINTFTDREWGDGAEDPTLFDPSALDARQWARAARAAGFRAIVLTAKHHDGFCLWPTATTDHSVAASRFRNGSGDVVREFVAACRAVDLRVGLYCSPWDRNAPVYGDSPRYNDMFVAQLTELLTRYGPVHEVWFDGANGEGPDGRRQAYDWPRFWSVVRRLQPDAVIFSDAGPDVRWIGNEQGIAGDPNWSMVNPATVPVPGMGGDEVMRQLRHGDRDGTVWRPGESDVSIRPGWFHHPAEDDRVRDVDDLVDLHFASVGRNSKLLLNVPPTRAGLLHDTDVSRLAAMRERLDGIFAEDLAAGARVRWLEADLRTLIGELDLAREMTIGIADLREDIEGGQRVARYTLEAAAPGGWRTVSRGTTIGHRKLDRFTPTRTRRIRIVIEDATEPPLPIRVALHAPA